MKYKIEMQDVKTEVIDLPENAQVISIERYDIKLFVPQYKVAYIIPIKEAK